MNLYIRRKKERKVSMLVILLFFISIFSGCIWGKFPKTVYAAGNRIVIDSYNIEKGDFTLGSTATIAFKLKNIGGSVNMKNIYIQMSSNSGITPVYGESNQKIFSCFCTPYISGIYNRFYSSFYYGYLLIIL